MAIENINEIDGLAFDDEKNILILLLTDYLPWDNELAHLSLLQDKINSYLSFIESKQYTEIYLNKKIEYYLIKITFKNDVTKKCVDFLSYVATQIKPLNIELEVEVTG